MQRTFVLLAVLGMLGLGSTIADAAHEATPPRLDSPVLAVNGSPRLVVDQRAPRLAGHCGGYYRPSHGYYHHGFRPSYGYYHHHYRPYHHHHRYHYGHGYRGYGYGGSGVGLYFSF